MADPRPVQRPVAAVLGALLVCTAVGLTACRDLLADPADARPIPLELGLVTTAAAGGSAEAFDKADRVVVRLAAGAVVVPDQVFPIDAGGGDIRLSITAPAELAGSQVTVAVQLLRGADALFVGTGAVALEGGADNTADIPLQAVAAAVLITPGTFTFDALGASTDYRAVAVFATGDTIDGAAPSFRSLAPGVVQVDASGVATSVAPGTTRIEASFGGTAAEADAIVQQIVTSIEVNQPATAIAAGGTYAFEPVLRDRNGYVVTGRSVHWTSSNPSVLTVDANGIAQAVGTGTVTVTGAVDQASISFQVQVAAPVPAAPGGLVALVQGTTVIVSWQDNSTNETRFELRVRPAPSAPFGLVSAAAANATNLSTNTNQPDARLEYTVRACNDTGCSADSNVAVAITVPSMPSDITVAYDTASQGYRAQWVDTSTYEDSFHVEVTFSEGAPAIGDVGANETSFVTRSFPREVRVSACNAAGCSDPAVYFYEGCDDCEAALPAQPETKLN
jgi:Bacterial Ig-like domain (group 2)